MQQIHWQDRFNIGVEVVDQAHRRLFSIVEKIMELYIEKHEDKFACVEGIKYFKAYAIRHFAEEEAYMREIGYPGYLTHKRHHDRMKRETLPALERALYASDFSTETVHRFIGVCTGWLTGHIIIEDRAITGKTVRKPLSLQDDGEEAVIREVLLYPLQEMFGQEIQFVGKFSTRDTILNAQHYEMIYGSQEGERLRFILSMDEQLLLRAAGLMFGIDFYARNEIVRFAMQEIAQHLIQGAAASFGTDPTAYQLEGDQFLTHEEYEQRFKEHEPWHSLLFSVKQECFSICVDRVSDNA
ncbi:MAG: hypothetical protein HFF18_05090 [Oscillospiraceae bacterium]|nr:hypothetical protein [Oscillospiraceae bacterium]